MKNKKIRNLAIMLSLVNLLSTGAIGEVKSISSSASKIYYFIDKNGKVKQVDNFDIVKNNGKTYVDENETISIFDEDNILSIQYGGSQVDLYAYANLLIKDPYVWEEIQKHFPVDSFSSEEEAMYFYILYLKKLGKHGCGYIAITDKVFQAFEGREDEFLETFGFPMYRIYEDNSIDFNYELFAIKFFNYSILYPDYNEERKELIKNMFTRSIARCELDNFVLSDEYKMDRNKWKTLEGDEQLEYIYKIQEIDEKYYELLDKWQNAKNEDVNIALPLANLGHIKEYLESYGIEVNINIQDGDEYIKPGDIVASSNFILYKENEYGKKYTVKDNINNHGVYVVAIEDGKIIVSSWGEKYFYDGKDAEETYVISIDINVKSKTKNR